MRMTAGMTALAGGVLLWAAFLVLALIARKFEAVFGRYSRWRSLAAAPSGLFLYALLLAWGPGALDNPETRQAAYLLLWVSGLVCANGARRFHHLLKSLENKDL